MSTRACATAVSGSTRGPRRGFPGSDLGLVRRQLLDEYDIDYGVLIPLQAQTFGGERPRYSAALCRALNDWIREEWLDGGAAPARLDLRPHESPGPRRARDRATGRRPAVRPGAAAHRRRAAASATRRYWPIYAPPPRRGCRSLCTPAASRAPRRRLAVLLPRDARLERQHDGAAGHELHLRAACSTSSPACR